VEQGIRLIGILVVLEDTFDVGADHNRLHRIAQQVADHAHAAGVR
jgi:hypothetical protein